MNKNTRKARRSGTSCLTPNKEKVREWAIKHGYKMLWQDKENAWHFALNSENVPSWAKEVEPV